MLSIGSFRSATCQGLTRRAFLRAGAASTFLLGSGLGGPLPARESSAGKSIILVWLWGAPSHLDTLDPKPNAPAEFRGPFGTIPTRTPGVRFTELLPRLAQRSNLFSLIRSNRSFDSDHLKAGTIAMTGALEGPGGVLPNYGSILARHRGVGDLPPFISLGRGSPRDVTGPMKGYGGGSWGRMYDPFQVACSETGEVDIPALKLLDGLTPDHLQDRRRLLGELDETLRKLDTPEQRKWDGTCDKAYALLTSPEARKALDLNRESEATREAYGQTAFGQSCLLARRLVQAGVPYVQVNWSQYVEAMTPACDYGWDTHIYNFDLLPDRHCPIFDHVFPVLLDDLRDRGMLEDTLIVCMGEFGRTPRINGSASRDHWPNVYSSIWAGAGVQAGKVIGESDRFGAEPLTEPITPLMMGTTMMEVSGVSTQARAELGVLSGGRVIHELF
jgi:hypothetical protein